MLVKDRQKPFKRKLMEGFHLAVPDLRDHLIVTDIVACGTSICNLMNNWGFEAVLRPFRGHQRLSVALGESINPKAAGMETRPTSSGYVGRVSIPADF